MNAYMKHHSASLLLAIALSSSIVWPLSLEAANDCRENFVGTWNWSNAAGRTNAVDFRSDGSAQCISNANCSPNMSWSCSGKRLTYGDGEGRLVLTLSPDGLTMSGTGRRGSQIVTRVGAASKSDAETGAVCVLAQRERQRASCVGPGSDCGCIPVTNNCPYNITVKYVSGGVGRSFNLIPNATSIRSACSTKSGEDLRIVGWKPWSGYPKPGQPHPRY
jgi:hypothetical protein